MLTRVQALTRWIARFVYTSDDLFDTRRINTNTFPTELEDSLIAFPRLHRRIIPGKSQDDCQLYVCHPTAPKRNANRPVTGRGVALTVRNVGRFETGYAAATDGMGTNVPKSREGTNCGYNFAFVDLNHHQSW